MNQLDFEKSVEKQIDYSKNLLFIKGDEYKRKVEDRLKYFKDAAKLMDITPKEALAGMMSKHTISIYSMCKDDKKYSLDKWTEKITDHINYLFLLKAMIEEEDLNSEEYSN